MSTELTIINFHAKNVKRLRAVTIKPAGNVVTITGRNAQGKSSVLDAIWFALGGKDAQRGTARPIRDGEDEATVSLDFGELVVTREWRKGKDRLVVTSADGKRHKSPQAILDALVGDLSFDPLAFAQKPPKEQLSTLVDLVKLPFDPAAMTQDRQRAYDARTEVGRQLRAVTEQIAAIPEPDPDLPAEELNQAELLAAYQGAQREADGQRRARERAETLESEIEDLNRRIAELQAQSSAKVSEWSTLLASIDAFEPVDVAGAEAALLAVQDTNAKIRAAQERRRLLDKQAAVKDAQDAHTAEIERLDEEKAKALRDADMPIDGLSLEEDGVTYQGIPLQQCSAAERLRVSVAIAMALNPSIRVIRLTDASLLDADNRALIEQMAREKGYQIWEEVVGDGSGNPAAVVIEDGEVKAS